MAERGADEKEKVKLANILYIYIVCETYNNDIVITTTSAVPIYIGTYN